MRCKGAREEYIEGIGRKREDRRWLDRPKHRLEDNIKVKFIEMWLRGGTGVCWFNVKCIDRLL